MDRVTFLSCDLGNLAEVKKVGDEIRQRENRMDVVSICTPRCGKIGTIHLMMYCTHMWFYCICRLLPMLELA